MADGVVSQAEFARMREVSRKTVSVWKQRGLLVLTADDKVDVVATNAKLAARPEKYRGGSARQAAPAPAAAPVPIMDLPPAEIASATGWTVIEAQRVKEVYLALLRKLEFETEARQLCRVEDVGRLIELEYATMRERLLAIPGKIAAELAGAPREAIELALRGEITEALDELHDPAGAADRARSAGGEAEAGAGDPQAATDPQPG